MANPVEFDPHPWPLSPVVVVVVAARHASAAFITLNAKTPRCCRAIDVCVRDQMKWKPEGVKQMGGNNR